MIKTLVILAALAGFDLNADLLQLDEALGKAAEYSAVHERRIQAAEHDLATDRPLTDEFRYEVYGQIYDLSYAFQYDRALEALNNQEQVAARMGRDDLLIETRLRKALLHCTAGRYAESMAVSERIDTAVFTSDRQLYLWYEYQQRFCRDFREYNHPGEGGVLDERAGFYRGRLIEYLPESNFLRQTMLLTELIEQGNHIGAGEVGSGMLARYSEDSHEYAIAAYYMGVLCREQGDFEGEVHWYIKSAIADIRSATKDNASLYCVALSIMDRDIARAFRYTQAALDDALFYNSKLRPGQIAQNLPAIEKAYTGMIKRESDRRTILMLLISLLVIVLVFILLRMLSYHRRLQEAIAALSEANAAKEEFLALFLSMSSGYLDKLRRHLGREQMEEELKAFYAAFDNAFLQLYPAFVEDFNALLEPEARVELKKGEKLNTELRIFALIRLGVDQSSHIASLLRYSVNTIYNYRAQTKAAALNGKDDFEEQVKTIGIRHN
ncbi:MAG: hypothetical protein J5668_02355 [Bacteroidales bacterium]|nr:hypothetical protein [Bacteroidales bacterium]